MIEAPVQASVHSVSDARSDEAVGARLIWPDPDERVVALRSITALQRATRFRSRKRRAGLRRARALSCAFVHAASGSEMRREIKLKQGAVVLSQGTESSELKFDALFNASTPPGTSYALVLPALLDDLFCGHSSLLLNLGSNEATEWLMGGQAQQQLKELRGGTSRLHRARQPAPHSSSGLVRALYFSDCRLMACGCS